MKLDRLLIACGFVGPIIFFFTIYFLFPFFYPDYSSTHMYISDLGAVDSPVKTLTNVFGFSLLGIFTMIFAYGMFRSREINALGKFAAIFFFATGGLMYLTGVFMGDAGENFSPRAILHNKVSDYQFPILAVGFIIFALSVIGNKNLRILTPIILALGAITLYLANMLFLSPPLPPPNVGILQRAAIGIPYFIVMIIAIKLFKVQKLNN